MSTSNDRTVSNETILLQLGRRYATKQFDPTRKISAQDWSVLEQSLLLTPSSFGLQPWKFIVITDPAVKAQFATHSWGQTQPADCSHMVVFAVKKGVDTAWVDKNLARIAEVRGVEATSLNAFRTVLVGFIQNPALDVDGWSTRQVYIALGNFMTTAAMMGIDTCPMEGISPEKYDEILNLTGSGFATVCACPAGYRSPEDKYAGLAKVRFALDEVVQRV